jgi:hypothetical protein
VNLRAGNSTKIRVDMGSENAGSIVNVTLYDPQGAKWHTVNVTTDVLGYAETSMFNLDGSNATAGSWMIQATATNAGLGNQWNKTGFFKRPFGISHSTSLDIDYPDDAVGTWITNVTYGDLILVIMKVNDTDSNVMVSGGSLAYTWETGPPGTFDDLGNGEYTKILNTSLLSGKGQFDLDMSWSKPNFDSQLATLTLNVNYPAVLESPQYPRISAPIGSGQEFIANFKNGLPNNDTGITGATLICNWTGSYSVTELSGGSYRFVLDVSGLDIGEYPIVVTAGAPYVEPQTMILYVDITEIYTTKHISSNQLSIPVGEAASFNLTWEETLGGAPITDGESYISCNWTSFHGSGENNYTVSHVGSGVYNITIFTESDDPLTAPDEWYIITFHVERPLYQNHTFDIKVAIRSHNTLFILDEPVEQTPIGGTIIVLTYYMDTDLEVGITNSSGNVHISITTPGVTNLQFTVGTSSYGNGHYNISIPSSQWGYIGWKNLTLTIQWTGLVTKYYGKTIDTSVRVLGTDTDLFLEQAPTATYFLNNVSFTTVYYDAITEIRISDSVNVHISITSLTGGHPVTQSDFHIVELMSNPGTYKFELNTSLFQSIGTFRFEIAFMWTRGVSPHYENKTMTVTLHVIGRPTYVDYTPVPSTPYSEIAEFSFTFIDALSTSRIEDSAQLTITLDEGSVDYVLTYDSVERIFTMSIDTATLSGIGVNTLHLNIAWAGEPFYDAISSQPFVVMVTLRSTQLTHLSFAPGQWGNNVSIEFIYTDLVSGSSVGMTGVLTLNASLAGWYSVVSPEDGHYLLVPPTRWKYSCSPYSNAQLRLVTIVQIQHPIWQMSPSSSPTQMTQLVLVSVVQVLSWTAGIALLLLLCSAPIIGSQTLVEDTI